MKLLAILLFAAGIPLPASALAQGYPLATAPTGAASGTAIAVQCPNGTVSCFGGSGSSAAASQPIALTPNAVAAAGTYQQAAASGKAVTNGGFLQPNAANTGLICVDVSAGASAGLTTPTGGQICQIAVGSTAPITFPATSGPVYVYGTVKGDVFSGSVS